MQSQPPEPPVRAAKAPERRRRIPLSCDPCRARKLKCNRAQPCQNCTARHQETVCRFHGGKGVSNVQDTAGEVMRQRIENLEDLVKSLVAERREGSPADKNAFPTPESSNGASEETFSVEGPNAPGAFNAGTGKTVVDGIRSMYLGGDDWYTVLEEINELKTSFGQLEGEYDLDVTPAPEVDGTGLLFNQVKLIDRMEILSSLPPKAEVDRLISWFFAREEFPITIPALVHEATFMREYNEHWRNPSQTGIIWLGLLFSILGMTMIVYTQQGEPPEYEGRSEALFQLYRMRTAQCLQSGDISKCFPYTVETLRFNATQELNRRDDNRRGLWIMCGVIIRTAVSQGYHRDPSLSPGISVLQAEYRRRAWSAVVSIDDMASFIGGFPRMMSSLHADTAEPRNLHEWEMVEGMEALPPSRPLAEKTPTTYLIVKGRLCRALGRVTDFNGTPGLGPYETVLEIDRALQDSYDNFPPHMIPASDTAGRVSIRNRADFSNLALLCMYHRGMCVLHRRFLARDRAGGRFRLSRDRCVASALALLGFQQDLEASLHGVAAIRQLLTLAAMVLVLELEVRRKVPDAEAAPDADVLLRALEESVVRWSLAADTYDDARKVHEFLGRIVSGFRTGQTGGGAGTTSTGEPGPPTWQEDPGTGLSAPVFSFEEDLATMDFDWTTWDAFLETGSEALPTS